MSNGFVHSIKVPRLYKTAAKIVRGVQENGESFKSLIYDKKHPNVSGIYALTYTTLQNEALLNSVIRNTGLLINEPRLDPWLAKILITELLWGKKSLVSNCKPIQTILAHEKEIKEALKQTTNHVQPTECTKPVKKPRYVRVNTLLLSVAEAISIFEQDGWILLSKSLDYSSYLTSLARLCQSYFIQDFHIPELFVFPPQTTFYENEYYLKGQIILQDKASCLPAFLLNPEPGSVVLDMCAAPGMKTTHLAAVLNNQGKVYATELHLQRYQTLCKQLEITNSTCVTALHADALTLSEKECSNVSYILVDPTCSGSGMIDRPKVGQNDGKCDEQRLQNLQAFQVFLLRHALLNFPSAKRVVYSTCSVYSKENEEVIDEILADVGEAYNVVSVKKLLQDNWINYSSQNFKCKDNCLYARPQVDYCNGFFLAVFERNFDVPLPEYKRRPNRSSLKTIVDNDFYSLFKHNAVNTDNDAGSTKDIKKRKKRGKRKRKSETQEELTTVEASLEKIVEQNAEEKLTDCSLVLNTGQNEVKGEVDVDIEPKKKKSKKSKERESVDANNTEPFKDIVNTPETQVERDQETVHIRKRKKSKRKQTENNEDNSTNTNTASYNAEVNESEDPVPKKKKKKKRNKE